jgi:hypothetical protein
MATNRRMMSPPSTARVDEKTEKKWRPAPASCWLNDFRRST